MFWYKAWLETKFKFLLALAFMVFYFVVFYFTRTAHLPQGGRPTALPAIFGPTFTVFAVILYTWLAGAGINTQPSFQATKGLHGSTLFTLSLPVSRLRLLTVRAGIGWLETAGGIFVWCYGLWLILRLGKSVSAVDLLQYVVTLVVCASSLYFLSVLLGTFFDDQWRMYTTAMATGALWMLCTFVPLPAPMNMVRAIMGESSPLITHTMPWKPMLFSLVLAAIFFLIALRIAQRREY